MRGAACGRARESSGFASGTVLPGHRAVRRCPAGLLAVQAVACSSTFLIQESVGTLGGFYPVRRGAGEETPITDVEERERKGLADRLVMSTR